MTATATQKRGPQIPFERIYRDLEEMPVADVKNAIAECQQAGGNLTTARVRKTLLPPAKARKPLPCSDAEIKHQSLQAIKERLAGKIAACMVHAGLTEAEEAAFERDRRRVVAYGYLPAANRYEAECR